MVNEMPLAAGQEWIKIDAFIMLNCLLNKASPNVVRNEKPPMTSDCWYDDCGNHFCQPLIYGAVPGIKKEKRIFPTKALDCLVSYLRVMIHMEFPHNRNHMGRTMRPVHNKCPQKEDKKVAHFR